MMYQNKFQSSLTWTFPYDSEQDSPFIPTATNIFDGSYEKEEPSKIVVDICSGHDILNSDLMNVERNARLEIIKLVREITLEEFTEKRIAAHVKWLSDSEKLWNNHRQILPYPVSPNYPNEEVILERATALLNFIQSK